MASMAKSSNLTAIFGVFRRLSNSCRNIFFYLKDILSLETEACSYRVLETKGPEVANFSTKSSTDFLRVKAVCLDVLFPIQF
jgi:hypothetical protein